MTDTEIVITYYHNDLKKKEILYVNEKDIFCE